MSKRVQCLSNLRQVDQAFVMYAGIYKDYIPVGFDQLTAANPMMQHTYGLATWSGVASKPIYTEFGRLYGADVLPDGRVLYCPSSLDPNVQFNTPTNVWPPGSTASPGYTLAGYCCRPVQFIAQVGPVKFPKLTSLTNQAIFGDWVFAAGQLLNRHVQGANILYANGSARWVDQGVFNSDLNQLTQFDVQPICNTLCTKIWADLDNAP